MAKKKDPSITFLNKFGYNVVKLPRAGIEPMDIIGKDDTTQWLGPIRSVWASTAADPVPLPPRAATAIDGQRSDKLDVAFGMRILANSLAAFGASVPSLDMAYHRARRVEFAFSDVTSTAIVPLQAGNYLAAGALNQANPVVEHYFIGEEAEAYLIVDVLKSTSLTVSAVDEHGKEIGVDVPAIQAVVGASVKVVSSSAANSTIKYSGTTPVTFGFIVMEIQREGEKWRLQGAEASGGLAFGVHAMAAGKSEAPGILLGSACRIRI
jgi:hypothetical protein